MHVTPPDDVLRCLDCYLLLNVTGARLTGPRTGGPGLSGLRGRAEVDRQQLAVKTRLDLQLLQTATLLYNLLLICQL